MWAILCGDTIIFLQLGDRRPYSNDADWKASRRKEEALVFLTSNQGPNGRPCLSGVLRTIDFAIVVGA